MPGGGVTFAWDSQGSCLVGPQWTKVRLTIRASMKISHSDMTTYQALGITGPSLRMFLFYAKRPGVLTRSSGRPTEWNSGRG